ncbi:hypothetical protein PGQ11_008135 [Apiospora arundinis]|uniref:Secreted protein n=1 Tax=Apiospora arundinis TaxID=335852 RepID=A0ABR2IES9_9PEZI
MLQSWAAVAAASSLVQGGIRLCDDQPCSVDGSASGQRKYGHEVPSIGSEYLSDGTGQIIWLAILDEL